MYVNVAGLCLIHTENESNILSILRRFLKGRNKMWLVFVSLVSCKLLSNPWLDLHNRDKLAFEKTVREIVKVGAHVVNCST